MVDRSRPLTEFEYFAPPSLPEVVALLRQGNGRARLIAGGTDLMLEMKNRAVQPEILIDLNRVPELSNIELDGDTLRIGATATLNQIKDSAAVRQRAPLLIDALAQFASHMIRNRATVAGNLCNASPAADLGPPLLALDAAVTLHGTEGARTVPLAEFFVAPGRTAMRPDEVLTEIAIPWRDGRSAYLKLGRRKGFAISIAAAAGFGVIADGRIEDIRLALCAVAPTPIRSRAAEAALIGETPSAAALEHAAGLVRDEIQRAADERVTPAGGYHRATPPYRVEMSYRMAKRVLAAICNGERAPELGAQG